MVINDSTPFVFISYAHRDTEKVLNIVNKMEEKGLSVWYDDRIEPGSEWDENIAAHIKKCMCFVAFVSRNYLDSDNCRDEINYARDLSKKQLLVYLEDVSLPDGMAMRMNRLQAVCMYRYADNEEKGLEKIFYACRAEHTGTIDRKEKSHKKLFICLILAVSVAACLVAAILLISRENKNKNNADSLIDNGSSAGIQKNMDELSEDELWEVIKDYTDENSDWSEMVPYLEKMAESGDAKACAYLGSYYAEHGGNDMESAIAWCGKGIDKYSSGYCAYLLAYFYFYGKGSFEKPDYVSCLCYVDMAVRLGYPDAAFYGAEIYYKGYLGETDTYKAEQYANIGIDSADEDLAEKCREILEEIE